MEQQTIPEKRDLSGAYFRTMRGGKRDAVCFEDLTEAEQDAQLQGRSEEWLRNTVKAFASILRKVGDDLDIVKA